MILTARPWNGGEGGGFTSRRWGGERTTQGTNARAQGDDQVDTESGFDIKTISRSRAGKKKHEKREKNSSSRK